MRRSIRCRSSIGRVRLQRAGRKRSAGDVVRAGVRFVMVVALAGLGSAPAWIKLGGRPPVEAKVQPAVLKEPKGPVPKITSIAPKMISNATSYPIMIYGESFTPGSKLEIGAGKVAVSVETAFVDVHHLTARVP